MSYSPGLHILAEISTENINRLTHANDARKFFYEIIHQYGLNPLGDVFHSFPEGGFTGTICLTESHLAVHTWPEYGLLTFDVFLSNYKQTNDGTARKLLQDVLVFFEASHHHLQEVKR